MRQVHKKGKNKKKNKIKHNTNIRVPKVVWINSRYLQETKTKFCLGQSGKDSYRSRVFESCLKERTGFSWVAMGGQNLAGGKACVKKWTS